MSRGNTRLVATDAGLALGLWRRVQGLVPATLEEDGMRWEAVGLNECFRLSKYSAGDRFQQHCDTCYQKNNEEKSMYTVNIYLNSAETDFEGGSTRFYSGFGSDIEYSVQPRVGEALVFRQPPHSCYSHDGEEVSSGLKYLLRSDVMYRHTPGQEERADRQMGAGADQVSRMIGHRG
jgi:prolyl 4-hydroxylase